MPAPYWIEPGSTDYRFPDVELALTEPDGLLAIGGDLSEERLVSAYQSGIFPWYSDGEPILWWSPNPRFVMFPEQLKVSRSLRKTIKKNPFRISINENFEGVIKACAETKRKDQAGTWITDEMLNAYRLLHQRGIAYSVEAWDEQTLVGGLYGISIGQVFFGESMFSHKTDASKVAFVTFVNHIAQAGIQLIDCQIYTDHLASLGACAVSRNEFILMLDKLCSRPSDLNPEAISISKK